VVKVTPAHDPNDYEVGKRHNLEFITVFDEKGILNSYAGEFEGLERLEAREKIVSRLTQEGNIEKILEHNHQVGHCYRCKNIVEPYISKQWFVKADVAKKSIEKTYAGETNFHPPHWINSYRAWMDNLNDWCISRQLWWGHRIPVFYCDDCAHEWADTKDTPVSCPKCSSSKITQDPDVLDTWFSSAMWPFSTLGWGENNSSKSTPSDLDDFYPNSLLITGFDILFFWVARMMMMGETFRGELPFKDIYLHALVRDESGAKMSKSKGNVIDPLDMVNEYSADIVRFTLAILAVQGRDIKLGKKHLEVNKNFTNKLYNAANYLQLNVDKFEDLKDIELKTELGRYINSRFNLATKEIREALDSYRFNDGASIAYRFIWNEFCDWGIELSKADKSSVHEIGSVFKESLKMLSPFMPFISEYLYHKLSNTSLENSKSIMIDSYPSNTTQDKDIEELFTIIQEAIVSIRRAKVVIDLANQKIDKAYIKVGHKIDTKLATPYIKKLAKVENVEFVDSKVQNSISDISDNLEVYLPTDEIDLSPIITKLTRQMDKLDKEIAKLNGMLNNEKFVANAPQKVIDENTQALANAEAKLAKVKIELDSFGKNKDYK
jgi:valyl-tRNA synthetase